MGPVRPARATGPSVATWTQARRVGLHSGAPRSAPRRPSSLALHPHTQPPSANQVPTGPSTGHSGPSPAGEGNTTTTLGPQGTQTAQAGPDPAEATVATWLVFLFPEQLTPSGDRPAVNCRLTDTSRNVYGPVTCITTGLLTLETQTEAPEVPHTTSALLRARLATAPQQTPPGRPLPTAWWRAGAPGGPRPPICPGPDPSCPLHILQDRDSVHTGAKWPRAAAEACVGRVSGRKPGPEGPTASLHHPLDLWHVSQQQPYLGVSTQQGSPS